MSDIRELTPKTMQRRMKCLKEAMHTIMREQGIPVPEQPPAQRHKPHSRHRRQRRK